MTVAVIGTDNISLNVALGLAEIGHNIICVDEKKERVNQLQKGITSEKAADLELMILRNLLHKRIGFICDLNFAFNNADVIYLCMDCDRIKPISKELKRCIENAKMICNTLEKFGNKNYKLFTIMGPVENWVYDHVVNTIIGSGTIQLDLVILPSLFKEIYSVENFLSPGRVQVYTESQKALNTIRKLFNVTISKGDMSIVSNISKY